MPVLDSLRHNRGIQFARYRRRRTVIVLVGILLAVLLIGMGLLSWMLRMPGSSFHGSIGSPTSLEQTIASRLARDLEHLSGAIGERNVSHKAAALEQAAIWIEAELLSAGWEVQTQEYEVLGVTVRNIYVESIGTSTPEEIVVIGAHYDSVVGSPGANDNGTGVVSLLEIARSLGKAGTRSGTTSNAPFSRTLRLVFFVNEEPPWFQQEEMGSLVYARRCHSMKENIVAMLSLETMGYFTNEKGSQQYPIPILRTMFPSTGNFIGFVGSTQSGALVRRCLEIFRSTARIPSEGAAIPGVVQGVGWSDHWSFQIHGYPALMVTDTAPFRYPHYHSAQDTPDKVDYDNLTRVTVGLMEVIRNLAR